MVPALTLSQNAPIETLPGTVAGSAPARLKSWQLWHDMLIGWPLATRPNGTGRLIESSPLKLPENRVSQKNCWPSCWAPVSPKYLFEVSTGGVSGRPDRLERRDWISSDQ